VNSEKLKVKSAETGCKRSFFLEIMKLEINMLMSNKTEKCNPITLVSHKFKVKGIKSVYILLNQCHQRSICLPLRAKMMKTQ